jgi:two-component system LytT family response regulator
MNKKLYRSERKIALPERKGLQLIPYAEILRIEARSSYSRIYFSNGATLVVAKVLRWFETQLDANSFIRIHRAHLINRDYINQYSQGKILLNNGVWLDVSRRKRTSFQRCWRAA